MASSRSVLIFGLLLLFFDTFQCVSVSDYTKTKIKSAINYFLGEGDCRTVLFREWPRFSEGNIDVEHYIAPGIIIWDVLRSHGSRIGDLDCPFCAEGQQKCTLRISGLWSDGSSICRYEPRVVYDTSSYILLVSAVYICSQNHQVPSHHPSILSRLPSSCYNSFFLTNRAGFTIELLSQVIALVDHGTSFHTLEDIVREQYEQGYWRMRLRFEGDCSRTGQEFTNIYPPFSQASFPFPHKKIMKDVYISYSLLFLPTFHADMEHRISLWISCDHTFKSVANIGFCRTSDDGWVRLFRSIFCVMGRNGDVLHWRLTRGESFEEVREIFTDLKKRFDSQNSRLEGIIIDNCCKWSGMFSSIFPGVPVKLDLFHAVQRFTSALPINIRKQSGISNEYGMIFRQPCDLEDSRKKDTPDPRTIILNLESFLKKWSSIQFKGEVVLNPNAIKAIENLRGHIMKGCLSFIPSRCSTSRNERLHREMNYILHSNKLGLDLAYIRCTRLFFKNNNKYQTGSELCCPPNSPTSCNNYAGTCSFGVDKGISIENSQSAVIGLDASGIVKSLHQLEADMHKIKNVISGSITCSQSLSSVDEHAYSSSNFQMNDTALYVALNALQFYEIYKNIEDIGYGRFLSKSKLPKSIGLANMPFKQLNSIVSNPVDDVLVNSMLSGHLEAFGLQHVAVAGDGNCFFSAVAFQMSLLLSAHNTPHSVMNHLSTIGIVQSMTIQEIATVLRMLVVNEWRGNQAEEYRNFLQENFDYYQEVRNYEEAGYFGGALGDLMPIAMSNVLQMPLVIITSEPHTPLISICPQQPMLSSSPVFLAYTSLGVGHYDAALLTNEPTVNQEKPTAQKSDKEQDCKDVHTIKLSKGRNCRCGERRQNKKVFKRKYSSKNRCRCISERNGCVRSCKCVGLCGGTTCKKFVFSRKVNVQTCKKAKHQLQSNRIELTDSSVDQNGSQCNFLESCVLSAIIQQMKSVEGSTFSWDANRIRDMYNLVISNLLSLGIVLPLGAWSRSTTEKELEKLKKLFNEK